MNPDVSIVDLLSSPEAIVRPRTDTQTLEPPLVCLISSDPVSSPVRARWNLTSDSESDHNMPTEPACTTLSPTPVKDVHQQDQTDDTLASSHLSPIPDTLKRITRPWDDPYASDISLFSSPPPEPMIAPSTKHPKLPALRTKSLPETTSTPKPPTVSKLASRQRSTITTSAVLKKGWSRLETVKDMICHLHTDDPSKWQYVADTLHEANAQVHFDDQNSLQEGFKHFELVIDLKRTTEDEFDEANRYFIKTSRRILDVPTKILVLEFSPVSNDWAEKIKTCYRDQVQLSNEASQIVFLVLGVKAAMRRYQQQYNRAIQRQVRAALNKDGGLETPEPHTVDPNTFQRAVIKMQARLQIECPAHVLYPDDTKHTQAWIRDLVRDISFKRYSERLVTPQIVGKRFPSIAKPTLKDLLRPVPGISPAVAQRVEDKYRSLANLSQYALDGTLNLDDIRGGSAIVLERLLKFTCCTDPSAALAAIN